MSDGDGLHKWPSQGGAIRMAQNEWFASERLALNAGWLIRIGYIPVSGERPLLADNGLPTRICVCPNKTSASAAFPLLAQDS